MPAGGGLDVEAARQFAETYLAGRVEAWDVAAAVPRDGRAAMASAGLFGALVDAGRGGSGLDMATFGGVCEQVGAVSAAAQSLVTVQAMAAWAIERWGTTDQHDRWLAAIAEGSAMAALCLSEPGGGAAMASVATTARAADGGWVLDGAKTWITAGQIADLFLVFARGADGQSAFLVPRDTPGIVVRPIGDMLGFRAGMVATVEFNNAEVHADALLGPAGFGGGMATHTLDVGRYAVACAATGLIRRCLELSTARAGNKPAAGRRLRDSQLVQAKLADMATAVAAGRALYQRAGQLKDAGDPATVLATWMAKLYATREAGRAAADAVQIFGAEGCGPGSEVARLYRDAKIFEIIEGTTEISQLMIASQVLRLGTI